MNVLDFLRAHGSAPDQIPGEACLGELLEQMDLGLAGQGNIPMLPSYLSTDIRPQPGDRCCVLDAGGTNLRTALAWFDPDGQCHLEDLRVSRMPGTEGMLNFEEFYEALARQVRPLAHFRRVGFCFSYNVTLDRSLDGKLDFWCKEVRVPEAVGRFVGSSLKAVLGPDCESVHVLNDSVAAMLGAGDVQTGVILGTGVNVCYLEKCENIPKITEKLHGDAMIVSTEIGEFDGIPKSDFETRVIAASDAPDSAHAEKQCSGAYLGNVINEAWRAAAGEGLLPDQFREARWDLADISRFLDGEGSPIPAVPEARQIGALLVRRAAKTAAILCAGPIRKAAQSGGTVRVAVEGSQYWKLTGFREAFNQELPALLAPAGIRYQIVKSENACLTGAALAAFARPM